MPILILGLLAGAAVFAFAAYQTNQKAKAFEAAARELGLRFDRPNKMAPGVISGEIRGLNVSVKKVTRGSGDDRKAYTQYMVGYPSVGIRVSLKKTGFGGSFKKFFGMDPGDVSVGDPDFDSSVEIVGPNPEEIRRFLSPARRAAALSLISNYRYVFIDQDHLRGDRRGIPGEQATIVHHILRVTDIAMIVSAPGEVDVALARQAEGDLGGAVESLHQINKHNQELESPNSFTQLLEAEALVAIGDGLHAKKALDGVAIGGDDELDGWKAVADQSLIAPSISSAAVGPVASADQRSIVDDLFGSGRESYETKAYFLDTYHGQRVTWTGIVDRVRVFRYDAVFDGAGQRAVVTVGSRGDGRLITGDIDAIVQLASDVTVQPGQTITFEGVLVRLDFYMRNIFVANAVIR